MFEVVPDCGGPIIGQPEGNSLASAIARTHRNNSGLPCPHGCKGTASRMFGLVSHLMEVHGYTEKRAWENARSIISKDLRTP